MTVPHGIVAPGISHFVKVRESLTQVASLLSKSIAEMTVLDLENGVSMFTWENLTIDVLVRSIFASVYLLFHQVQLFFSTPLKSFFS